MLVYRAKGQGPFLKRVSKGINNLRNKVMSFFILILLFFFFTWFLDFCIGFILSLRFITKGRPFLIAIEDPQAPENDVGKNSFNYFQVC